MRLGPPLLVAVILVIALATTTATYAQNTHDHPDDCMKCHADYSNDRVNDTAASAFGGSVWNHTIYTDEAWNRCSFCHTGVADGVSRSPHNVIGCGCHAVVHTGKYYGQQPSVTGTWAAWLMMKVVNYGGTPVIAPDVSGPEGLKTKKFYFEYGVNASDINSWLSSWTGKGANVTEEIEVWLSDPNGTILDGSTGKEYYQVCFNCHFLAAQPGDLGAFRLEGGVWKIGIPELALKLPPHEISSEAIVEGYEGGGGAPEVSWAVQPLALIGAGALGIVLLRRR